MTLILEILNSLDLKHIDLSSVFKIDAFPDIEFSNYTYVQDCVLFDVARIKSALESRAKEMESQLSEIQNNNILASIDSVLKHLENENIDRKLCFAKDSCVDGWSQIVLVTLSEGFHLFDVDSRESVLFSILSLLLPIINKTNCRIENVESLSNVVLALVNKLESLKSYHLIQDSLVSGDYESRLPWDSLQQVILKGIIDACGIAGGSVKMRGTFYSALISYFRFSSFDDKLHEQLLVGNQTVLLGYGDKFFDLVCRDATDGADIWKTVAFSLLACMFDLFDSLSVNSLLDFLHSSNFLQHYIMNIKSDNQLFERVLMNHDGFYN